MKKLILTVALGLFFIGCASAQILPSFQFGIKGGTNLTSLTEAGKFTANSEAGYIGGFWARFGAAGFNFQPEIYLTQKDVNITYTQSSNEVFKNPAKFTSVDVPLLFGTKIGDVHLGARFYTGPVISFALNRVQTLSAASLNYNDQNYSWQLGGGLDLGKFSADLRYEAGINKLSYGTDERSHTRINLFNLTLSYQIFSIL